MSYRVGNNIALKVKKRLDETKTTKQSLADHLKMARSTLWRFLEGKGETILNDEQMEYLSSFLNCSINEVNQTDERNSFDICEFFAPTFKFVVLDRYAPMIVDCQYLGIDNKDNYKAILSACSYDEILYGDRLLVCVDKNQKLLSDKYYYLILGDQICIRKIKINPFTGEVYIKSDRGEYDVTFTADEWVNKVEYYFRIVAMERFFE